MTHGKEWLCRSVHRLNCVLFSVSAVKGGRGVTANPVQGTPAIPISIHTSSKQQHTKSMHAVCILLHKNRQVLRKQMQGQPHIMHLSSATMLNIELFCSIPVVRSRLLPGRIAGARQEQLFWFPATGNLTAEQTPPAIYILLFVFPYVLSLQLQQEWSGIQAFRPISEAGGMTFLLTSHSFCSQ